MMIGLMLVEGEGGAEGLDREELVIMVGFEPEVAAGKGDPEKIIPHLMAEENFFTWQSLDEMKEGKPYEVDDQYVGIQRNEVFVKL